MDDSLNMPLVIKLIIVGDSAVGKSSLLKRFGDGSWNTSYNATVGIDFIIRNHKHLKFQCWDTAGQEKFRSVTATMFRNAHVVLFAYDMSNPVETLQHLLDYYLTSNAVPEDAYRLLVGTKSDIAKNEPPPLLVECQTRVHGTFFTSAKSGEGVMKLFDDVCQAHESGRIVVTTTVQTHVAAEKRRIKSCC
jgi:small GTP-binding protein